MTVNDAMLDSWRYSLHAKQPRTVRLYLEEAHRFAAWLANHDRPDTAPGQLLAVTRRDCEAWIADMQGAGRAKATIRSRWIAMRSFYNWAVSEDEIDVSPLAKVTVPRPDPPPPPVLSGDELRALFRACAGRSFEDRRDMALIRLLVATGLRVSEACAMTVADVDYDSRLVYVRSGKGDKMRVVRFDPETRAALDRYQRLRAGHKQAEKAAYWLGFRGPLTRKGVPSILDKRTAIAGIRHTHAHMLRHCWASRWMEAGGNEGDLQRLGGWESAEVMRRYGAALAQERALRAYDNVDPMSGL